MKQSIGIVVAITLSGCIHRHPTPTPTLRLSTQGIQVLTSRSVVTPQYRIECGVGYTLPSSDSFPKAIMGFLRLELKAEGTCFFPFGENPYVWSQPSDGRIDIRIDWSYIVVPVSPFESAFPATGEVENRFYVWEFPYAPTEKFNIDAACAIGVYSPCPTTKAEFEAAPLIMLEMKATVDPSQNYSVMELP